MFNTTDNIKIDIEKLGANESENLLKLLRPDLTKVMKSYDLDEFSFYKASYPFGNPIINAGKCYLPLANGESIEFNDSRLPATLADDLAYDSMTEDPLAIILSKNSEFYLPTRDTIMPHAIIHPGEMIGIPKAIAPDADSSLIWNLNAGARYLFTLTRVTSQPMHSQLQKTYGIQPGIPLSPLRAMGDFCRDRKGC